MNPATSPADRAEHSPDDERAQQRERQHRKADRNPFAHVGRVPWILEYMDGKENADDNAHDEAKHIGRRIVGRPKAFALGSGNSESDHDHDQKEQRPKNKTEQPH